MKSRQTPKYQQRLLNYVAGVCSAVGLVLARLVSKRGASGKVHACRRASSLPSDVQVRMQQLSRNESESHNCAAGDKTIKMVFMRMRGVVNKLKCMQEAAVVPAFGAGTR